VSRLGAAVEGLHPPKRPPSCAYKMLSVDPPLCWSIFPLRPARVPSSVTLSQSIHLFRLVWISNLISMISTCCQPIAHSSPHASIVKFLRPPASYDASVFRGFQVPPAVGQSLQPAVKQVVDLTCDDDGDSEGGDADHTEVSWLRTIRAA
jgi:hypothetical protein